MDKEKEIEEIHGIILSTVEIFGEHIIGTYISAEKIVNAGYRKADEVRKETMKKCSAWLHENAVVMEEEAFAREFDEAFDIEVEE